jgi:hypothetical protein
VLPAAPPAPDVGDLHLPDPGPIEAENTEACDNGGIEVDHRLMACTPLRSQHDLFELSVPKSRVDPNASMWVMQ